MLHTRLAIIYAQNRYEHQKMIGMKVKEKRLKVVSNRRYFFFLQRGGARKVLTFFFYSKLFFDFISLKFAFRG